MGCCIINIFKIPGKNLEKILSESVKDLGLQTIKQDKFENKNYDYTVIDLVKKRIFRRGVVIGSVIFNKQRGDYYTLHGFKTSDQAKEYSIIVSNKLNDYLSSLHSQPSESNN